MPNARSLRNAPTHPEIRRKKPTATPPKVAGIVPRLETATDGLGDACELAGARGSDSAGAERGCLEPGFAALAENDRTPGGACTDARIGVLTWCRAAFELVEARGPGAGGFRRAIPALRACPDAAGGDVVAGAGERGDATKGELRRSTGAFAPRTDPVYCLSEY